MNTNEVTPVQPGCVLLVEEEGKEVAYVILDVAPETQRVLLASVERLEEISVGMNELQCEARNIEDLVVIAANSEPSVRVTCTNGVYSFEDFENAALH